ncbi:MAG: 2Fe-2S iron-sulfur cluster-binding protein [Acidobacteriota bacterium]
MEQVELKFEGEENRSGLVAVGSYLFDAARRLGIEVKDECGRRGECDSCALKITQGAELLSTPTAAENTQLGEQRIKDGERLSCQTKLEKVGEITIMITQKNEENKPETEEEKINEFRKEFEDLPLEKKIASLVELEVIALRDTFSLVLNSPYLVAGKIMDVMAEFGMKIENEDRKAKRPEEHKEKENGASAKKSSEEAESKTKSEDKKKTAKKTTAKKVSDEKADDKDSVVDAV